MSYCIKCGRLAKDQERFCSVCGTPLVAGKNQAPAKTVTVTKRKKVAVAPLENSNHIENNWKEQQLDFNAQNEEQLPLWEEDGVAIDAFEGEREENNAESLFSSVIDNFQKEGEELPSQSNLQYTPWDGSDSANQQEWFNDYELDSKEVMPVGRYLISLIWMLIPVLGLILSIIWASGGTRFKERTNLARASLILLFIIALFGGGIALYLTRWYF